MGVKKFRISHFRKDCIGCGSCALINPENWEMNEEDGMADLKGAAEKNGVQVQDVDIDLLEENREAAESCPVSIIRIQDNIKE